ncbi:MAG: hypothetical protein ACR2PZ_22065 [Pseudomonadales bacterium]
MDSEAKQQNYKLAAKLLAEQNFAAAVFAGFVAAIWSAGIYGIAKSLSESLYYSILAAVLGVAIGITMQILGRGIDRKFALAASATALLGCMLGNMFAVVVNVARATVVSPFIVLSNTTYSELYRWVFTDLRFADIMFGVIGIGGAAYFARRPLTREEGLALHFHRMKR